MISKMADLGDEIDRGSQTGPVVSQLGSSWLLDQHRLLCGTRAAKATSIASWGEDQAAIAFLDVPYNVRVRSIGGHGRVEARGIVFASADDSSGICRVPGRRIGNATGSREMAPFTLVLRLAARD